MIGNKDAACPLMHALAMLSGKWKASIIWYLGVSEKEYYRFNEFKKEFPYNVTHKVFLDQLRELEEDGLVRREEYDEQPPRVEYSLTNKGRSLLVVLFALRDWCVLYDGNYDIDDLLHSPGNVQSESIVYSMTSRKFREGGYTFELKVNHADPIAS